MILLYFKIEYTALRSLFHCLPDGLVTWIPFIYWWKIDHNTDLKEHLKNIFQFIIYNKVVYRHRFFHEWEMLCSVNN